MCPAARPYNRDVNATILNRALTVLAWAGIFTAGMLSVGAAMNVSLPCGADAGCDAVAAHPGSRWADIPVAYFGLASYFALAALAGLRSLRGFTSTRWTLLAGFGVSGVGTLVSAYLTIFSITVIRATCEWCLASAAIMVLTFFGYVLLGQQEAPAEPPGPLRGRQAEVGVLAACAVLAIGGVGAQAAMLQRAQMAGPQAVEGGRTVTTESLAPKAEYWLGPTDAPIQIVEFADFYCPGCRESFPRLMEAFQRADGRMRVAFRNFPIFEREGNEMALKAAVASEFAADHGQFWRFVRGHFERPVDTLADVDGLLGLVRAIGLDAEELNRRILEADPALLDRVVRDRANGRRIGLEVTPTYVIFAPGVPPRLATSVNLVNVLAAPEYQRHLAPPAGDAGS